MGAARIVIICVALVAAIGLAVVVRNMMGPKNAPGVVTTAVAQPMTRVLVAKRDLPVGTRLVPEDLDWQPWPASNVNAAFITDGKDAAPKAQSTPEKATELATNAVTDLAGSGADAMQRLAGAIVREQIASGEPVLAKKLVRGGEGGYMAVVLNPGMRAFAIPVSVVSAAGGFILPGDKVDVLQTMQLPAKGDAPPIRVTQPVVVNVKVLAIDQKTTPDEKSNALPGAVATLELTPDSVDALVEAIDRGDLQLALRSYADGNAPSGRASPRGATNVQVVRVFRNGQPVDVAVQQ